MKNAFSDMVLILIQKFTKLTFSLFSLTFIGDVTAPILRVLPFESKRENNYLHQEFVNVHYVPVAKSFIDQVHITIKGDTGENVKLHFRQKE